MLQDEEVSSSMNQHHETAINDELASPLSSRSVHAMNISTPMEKIVAGIEIDARSATFRRGLLTYDQPASDIQARCSSLKVPQPHLIQLLL